MSKVFRFIKKEIKEALPAVIFFFVIFHLGAITQALLLKDYGITNTRSAIATAFALIVAKVILIADKLPVAKVFHHRPAIYTIAWKTFIFGLITLLFRFIEETIPVAFRYGSIRGATEHFFQDLSWSHFWAIQMWLTVSLALFCTAAELIDECSAARVKKRLFGSQNDPPKNQ